MLDAGCWTPRARRARAHEMSSEVSLAILSAWSSRAPPRTRRPPKAPDDDGSPSSLRRRRPVTSFTTTRCSCASRELKPAPGAGAHQRRQARRSPTPRSSARNLVVRTRPKSRAKVVLRAEPGAVANARGEVPRPGRAARASVTAAGERGSAAAIRAARRAGLTSVGRCRVALAALEPERGRSRNALPPDPRTPSPRGLVSESASCARRRRSRRRWKTPSARSNSAARAEPVLLQQALQQRLVRLAHALARTARRRGTVPAAQACRRMLSTLWYSTSRPASTRNCACAAKFATQLWWMSTLGPAGTTRPWPFRWARAREGRTRREAVSSGVRASGGRRGAGAAEARRGAPRARDYERGR